MFPVVPSLSKRASTLLLVAALTLATLGAAALGLSPSSAHAEPLPPAAADFTLKPGDSVTKDFTKAMIGSAEARPDPDGCRNNPALALTCAAHRIKLVNRTPGYFLRISTFWVDKDAGGNSVPDVDTYLFDGPGSSFDYDQVGGVSGAMPEQIKLVNPAQDEFDYVLGVYAGAISDYSVSVEYTNATSAPTAGILPDFVLSPHDAPIIKSVTSTLAVPTISGQAPDSCRNDPTQDVVCDVYRIKLKRNLAEEAQNFVVITLYWDPIETPDLSTPAAGLGGEQSPNLDLYVWDTATHILEGTGGNLFLLPERAGFIASQDEYDLTIQSKRGVSSTYKLEMFMTDEIFAKPNELLDPVTGQPVGTKPVDDESAFDAVAPSVTPAVPALALAPIDTDSQIAGIGLGTTEQFGDDAALALGRAALRNTAATSDPPSGIVLALALGIIPAGLLAASVFVVRRRHTAIF